MYKAFSYRLLACFVFLSGVCAAQNETNKWYFGTHAGLDFTTNPPTSITGSMVTFEGCASMADASGNLLLYTDGSTVYNQTHAIMANGTGLLGFSSSSQSGIIVKQPGNTNIYYVFTQGATSGGLRYSVVDMSLAVGMGSVTAKNIVLITPSSEKLTSVRHCNGVDVWVLTHDYMGSNFQAYLVNASGVNATPVVSAVGVNYTGVNYIGCIKLSPNGKKLACGLYGSFSGYEVYDFDSSTGIITNPIYIGPGFGSGYGVEFSPDGTKFYGGTFGGQKIFQWDLCAGSPTAVVASCYTVVSTGAGKGQLQLASDGKIYIARSSQTAVAVINAPNVGGSGCNYVEVGPSIAPNTNQMGLPNFITSGLKPPPPPFTYTLTSCQTFSFAAPAVVQTFSLVNCSAMGYSLTGMEWHFGDPLSGASNTATSSNPTHLFSSIGTYTTDLIMHYTCGGGTDTIRQVINVTQPCISVSSSSITCASLGSATVSSLGAGPFSYTWMPTNQASPVATGLAPGSYTITVYDGGNNLTYTNAVSFLSAIPLTGNLSNSSTVACHGATTATASITGLAGGSNNSQNVSYAWTGPQGTFTTSAVTGLGAGTWNVIVTDALTGCQINQTFFITEPPALALNLASNSPSACIGGSVVLTGTNSGGTPSVSGAGYTYTWTNGPPSDTYTVSENIAGLHAYTLSSSDGNACVTSSAIVVAFVNPPTLTVSSVSICPLQTGTLTVTGASSYTWSGGSTGGTFTASPPADQQYTVTGSALGCTAAATGSVFIKPVPVPSLSNDMPLCSGHALQLHGSGGQSYAWSGPLGFSSTLQNPVVAATSLANSGSYQLTVTAANSCTASITLSVTINPTPTLALTGSTVCLGQTLTLSAASAFALTYAWSGPDAFSSTLQNPSISNSSTLASGNYTVTVASVPGCTNLAVVHASVVVPPVPSFVSNSPRCVGDNLLFNASASAGAVGYAWSGPQGFASAVQSPSIGTVSLPAAGVYTLVATTGPCVASFTQAVIVNPLPGLAATVNPASTCDGKPTQISATGSGTVYAWAGPSFVSNASSAVFAAATFSNAGVYTVTTTDINNCISFATTTITILANPVVTALGATVCTNDTSRISAHGAVSYAWQGPSGYSSVSQPAVIPVTMAANVGTYTVTGTAVNGCTSIATADINILPIPVPVITAAQQSCCANDTLVLRGSPGTSHVWTGPNNFRLVGQNIKFIAFGSSYSGTYTLTVRDLANQCPGSTTQDLAVRDLPSGALNGKLSGCVPYCPAVVFFPNSRSASITAVSWKLNTESYTGSGFTKCFYTPGTYSVYCSFKDIYDCANTVTTSIYSYAKPLADFEVLPETPVENSDQPVIFSDASKGEDLKRWSWTVQDGSSVSLGSAAQASHYFNEAGTYPVAMTVVNAAGCSDTIVKLITVDTDLNVYIPNAFTPNADGKNELFMPVTRSITLLSFEVYDRWGEKLFSATQPGSGWDGTYHGQPCKQDVYVWRFEATDKHGNVRSLKGYVTLLR